MTTTTATCPTWCDDHTDEMPWCILHELQVKGDRWDIILARDEDMKTGVVRTLVNVALPDDSELSPAEAVALGEALIRLGNAGSAVTPTAGQEVRASATGCPSWCQHCTPATALDPHTLHQCVIESGGEVRVIREDRSTGEVVSGPWVGVRLPGGDDESMVDMSPADASAFAASLAAAASVADVG